RSHHGGRRVCVAAVENIPRLAALCTTPVTEGMVIGTDTAQIKKIRPTAELPDDAYPFLLTIGRILTHYHTGTMTRRSRGLHEVCPEGFIAINGKDAYRWDVEQNELIRVTSGWGTVEVNAWVTSKVPSGAVYMKFHFSDAPANRLTIAALDPKSGIGEAQVYAEKTEKAAPWKAALP
ncbi:MAG: molybdopterin dinucleotide binding domain-containing protein, partial [bacterium]|nr:molybdopterin dinucleotide binding domain-containing protein [bacterium]